MMMYTLESRRTFRGDLALCGLHEFLRLNVTDIHEKVSGTVSASAFPRKLPEFSSFSSSIDRFNLSSESCRVRWATPSCHRRRMTVCVQVWILRTLSAVVSRVRGQNTLLLCLHVRRFSLCCQLDCASDWVGSQDLYHTAGGIIYLCISHSLVRPFRSDESPIRRIRRYETSPPRYAQVIGARRSAAYRWKPGIGITASSYSALRRRGMSESRSVSILSAPPGVGVVQPPHTCSRSRMDVGYGYSPLQLDDYTVVI